MSMRPRRPWRTRWMGISVICLGMLASCAAAQAPHYLSAEWDVRAATGSATDSTGPVTDTPAVTRDFSFSGDHTSAALVLDARYGVLKATAIASAAYDPAWGGRFAVASGTVEWDDTLTVTSAALPPGAPVRLLLSVRMERTLGITGVPYNAPAVSAEIGLGLFSGDQIAIVQVAPDTPAEIGASLNLLLDTSVGAAVDIGTAMSVNAAIHLTPAGAAPPVSGTATADVSHGALFALNVLTPGASVTTDSGTAYPAILFGDANASGAVDMADVRDILRAAGGLARAEAATAADVAPAASDDPRGFGDGRLTLADALRVLRYLRGHEPVWP